MKNETERKVCDLFSNLKSIDKRKGNMGKEKLKRLFEKNKKEVLSIYITSGYPQLESMPELIKELVNQGVDFIEVGMPYSDPLADGDTIQYSSSVALKNGIDLDKYFEQVKRVRSKVDIPLLFMGYFNQVLRYGMDKFLTKCVESGIDGLILPDMPPEIYRLNYMGIFDKYDLSLSFLITPTTSDERIRMIDKLSSGFVYVVSSSSTTGKIDTFDEEQINYFERIKGLKLKNPTVVGFGISNREKFLLANKYTNGAIIGSAFIKAIKEKQNYLEGTNTFIKQILDK